MGQRYTKFNSNYLMRSHHQETDLGRIMERDWVTTNGMNVLRFGSGRRVWYNSGNFVFTTSNVPSYHKKHKLSTEVKTWEWKDVADADGTVNTIRPNFYTNDLRNYAYYGSCVELIRATIEDIISEFPGCLQSTIERIGGPVNVVNIDSIPSYIPSDGDISYDTENDSNICYIYENNEWKVLETIDNETLGKNAATKGDYVKVGGVYYDLSDDFVKKLFQNTNGTLYFDAYGIPTSLFNTVYYYNHEYYRYSYKDKTFNVVDANNINSLINGYILRNQFNIDLHHKTVTLEKYDNPMRFMCKSWDKYCIVKGETIENIKSFTIEDVFFDNNCPSNNEYEVIKRIIFITENDNEYVVEAYYINGEIVYVYNPKDEETVYIQPQQKYIDEYFASLDGFKKQLLRQDTKPYYCNTFITPIEYNFIWYYVERNYVWPSIGYCIDIDSTAFSSFIDKLYDMCQHFDDMWSDNLYRSMTHEAIKNFDWTYSREYYENDAQDNIDGGERMQKIIRVIGKCFDDIKTYIDTIKIANNVSYDKYNNGSEALLSDKNSINGINVVSTISSDYDINNTITNDFINGGNVKKNYTYFYNENVNSISKLPTWYPTRNSTDIYPDVCDNEIMRRLALSAKRIMQTKGTQQGIEMVMGLFGFGKGIDYDITEEAYYTEKMIPYNECIDGTLETEKNGEDWTDIAGIEWNNINSTIKGDLAIEVNSGKNADKLYYEDMFSGIPMRSVLLGRNNETFLVPYYDSSLIYDGDLHFQGKGGWGRMIKLKDDDPYDDYFDYQETLSYLHVAPTLDDLFSISPRLLKKNAIYYVTNLNNYIEYDEYPPIVIEEDEDGNKKGMTMSHFFILQNLTYSNEFFGWKNIVVQPSLDEKGNYQQVDENIFTDFFGEEWSYSYPISDDATLEDKLGCYQNAFKKMQYLDSIISTNIGNNPHTGYGNYDEGQNFIEYMKLPFKYAIDNADILDYSLSALAKEYSFDDICYCVGDILSDKSYEELSSENKEKCYCQYRVIEEFDVEAPTETPTEELTGQLSDEETAEPTEVEDEQLEEATSTPIIKHYDINDIISETTYNTLSNDNKKHCQKEWEVHYSFSTNIVTDKIQIMNTRQGNTTDFIKYKIDGEKLTEEYAFGEDEYNNAKRWYINTKILTITNLVELDKKGYFSNYFKLIIMPYLMQVIPSTTILKLKNFV